MPIRPSGATTCVSLPVCCFEQSRHACSVRSSMTVKNCICWVNQYTFTFVQENSLYHYCSVEKEKLQILWHVNKNAWVLWAEKSMNHDVLLCTIYYGCFYIDDYLTLSLIGNSLTGLVSTINQLSVPLWLIANELICMVAIVRWTGLPWWCNRVPEGASPNDHWYSAYQWCNLFSSLDPSIFNSSYRQFVAAYNT